MNITVKKQVEDFSLSVTVEGVRNDDVVTAIKDVLDVLVKNNG